MTDPLVLRHGLDLRADQPIALQINATTVEDSFAKIELGELGTGRSSQFRLGSNNTTEVEFYVNVDYTGSEGKTAQIYLNSYYNGTGELGLKSYSQLSSQVGPGCTEAGVSSDIFIYASNFSTGPAAGTSAIRLKVTNTTTGSDERDSYISLSGHGYIDILASGYTESYISFSAGKTEKSTVGFLGAVGPDSSLVSFTPSLGSDYTGYAKWALLANNNSNPVTSSTGALGVLSTMVSASMTLPNVVSSITITSENFSTPPAFTGPGVSWVGIHASNASTDALGYNYVDRTYLELKSDAQINLKAIEDFGFITMTGGNQDGTQHAYTQVDVGLIQDGSLGVGPALFKVLARSGDSGGSGDHSTAIQLDASYGAAGDPVITKGYTVAAYSRLSSTVYNGPPSAQLSKVHVYATNVQQMSGAQSHAIISAYGGYDQYSQDALVFLQSDGVIRAESKYYTQVDGVYFVPGGSDSTADPKRYAFQELMLYLWSATEGPSAKVFLGPGYHNVNRPAAAPIQLGGVTVTGSSNWFAGNGRSIIYFESTDAASYIQMNYGSTIENCVFEASGPLINHDHAIRIQSSDNAIRNCQFNDIITSNAGGAGTGDGSLIYLHSAQDTIIENCNFIGDGCRHVISIYLCDNITIRDCSMGRPSIALQVLSSAIRVDATNTEKSANIEISGNFIYLSNSVDVQECIYLDSYVQHCNILNNSVILETTTQASSSFFVSCNGTESSEASNGYHLISGNNVTALQGGEYNLKPLIALLWNPNVIISDNHVEASKWGYSQYTRPLIATSATPSENLKIVNNIFDAEDCTAFYAAGSNEHYGYAFKGNTFKGCRGSLTGSTALSRVGTIRFGSGGCSGMIIEGNMIDFNNDDGTNTAFNSGIIQTSGAVFTDCTIANNIFRKSSLSGAIHHYALNLDDYTACALNGNVTVDSTNLFIGASTSSAYGDDGTGQPTGDTNI